MGDVFVHIVTWNSEACVERCIRSLLEQTTKVVIQATDNCSYDSSPKIIEKLGVECRLNPHNFGFCAAHNQGVASFLKSSCKYLLILNPDTILKSDTIQSLVEAVESTDSAGLATPKLLRMDEKTIDAAGMHLAGSLRHFDRGAGEIDQGQFNQGGKVFGGTGACLLIKRACVESLILPSSHFDVLKKVYPHIPENKGERSELFDENFFAYREDADLSWRAQSYGWDCIYEPRAVALHGRVVTPERRSELPAMLNMLGVQNRFLLQINNYSPASSVSTLFSGFLLRNLTVLGGLALERTSIPAIRRIFQLLPRALAHRKENSLRSKRSQREVIKWASCQLEKR